MKDRLRVVDYESSLFIIKPDAYEYKAPILKEILERFKLLDLKEVILTEDFLVQLYQNEIEEFKIMNVEYMKNRKAVIGVVSGPDCRKKLFEICGEDFRPEKCSEDTIRYKYNICPEPIKMDGKEFYVNAIHRASPEDAEKEIELYRKEYINKIEKNKEVQTNDR